MQRESWNDGHLWPTSWSLLGTGDAQALSGGNFDCKDRLVIRNMFNKLLVDELTVWEHMFCR